MEYLLGLDIGTSSAKAVLMSYDGQIVNVKTKKHTYYFENDMKLMDAELFCENCFDAISEITKDLDKEDCVSALCVSGAGGNLMLVKDGKSCSPVYGWQTRFDASITENVLSRYSREDIHKTVGWFKIPGFPLSGLAYLKETNPKLIENADMVCMHIEYLNYLMTGKWGITRSMGTTFYLIDQEKGEYYKEYLELLGITENKLVPIVKNCSVLGGLNHYIAKKTGLKEGTPVIAGTFDHPAAARGSGVSKENQVLVSCGTSWVVFVPFADRETPISKGMLVDPFMAPDGNWCGMKSLSSISETIDKLQKKFLGEISYAEFDSLANKASKGCNGLVIEDENTDVSCYKDSDIARAIMECIAKKLNSLFEMLELNLDVIRLVGGITNSKVWCRVISEITDKKVEVINGEHAGAIGSAIMAGVGVGIYHDEIDAYEKIFKK